MRIFRTIWIFAGLMAFAANGHADQSDPRLGALFDDLKTASGAAEADAIEQRIWTIWLEAPDDEIHALMLEGSEAMGRGDRRAALDVFDRIVVLAPDFAEGWNKRATVHYLLNNLEESLVDIEATVALEPRHFGALSGRGLVFIKMRDLQQALASFEEAQKVSPRARGVAANIQAIRELLGQREI